MGMGNGHWSEHNGSIIDSGDSSALKLCDKWTSASGGVQRVQSLIGESIRGSSFGVEGGRLDNWSSGFGTYPTPMFVLRLKQLTCNALLTHEILRAARLDDDGITASILWCKSPMQQLQILADQIFPASQVLSDVVRLGRWPSINCMRRCKGTGCKPQHKAPAQSPS